MRHPLLFSIALFTAFSATAQQLPPSPAYKECTSLSSSDPATALQKADAWLNVDTSIAAQHCRAMALYGLQRYAEAATSLSSIRDAIGRDNPSMRSYITQQAGQAFANANQVDRALSILGAQIDELSAVRGDNVAVAKMTADLLLDRARLNANYGKLNEATKDLDHAVSLTPLNDELLAERAVVFEKFGDKALARNDAENAMKLNSANAKAKELLVRLGALPSTPVNLAAPSRTPALDAASIAPAAGPQQPDAQHYAPPLKKKSAKKNVSGKAQPATTTPATQAP